MINLIGHPIKTPAVVKGGLVIKDAVLDTTKFMVNTIGELTESAKAYRVSPATPTTAFAGVPPSETHYFVFPDMKTAMAVLDMDEAGNSRKAPVVTSTVTMMETLRPFFEVLPLRTRVAFANDLAQIRVAAEAGDTELAGELLRRVRVPAELAEMHGQMLAAVGVKPTFMEKVARNISKTWHSIIA